MAGRSKWRVSESLSPAGGRSKSDALLRRLERTPHFRLRTRELAADEGMRQVLGYQDVTNILAVHREVPAGAVVIAQSGSFGAGPAGAVDQLQVDSVAGADDLAQPDVARAASIRSMPQCAWPPSSGASKPTSRIVLPCTAMVSPSMM